MGTPRDNGDAPLQITVRSILAADLGIPMEEVMRIGRAIIIPAIVALGVAGSTLAVTATPLAAAHTSNVHVVAQAPVGSNVFLHT